MKKKDYKDKILDMMSKGCSYQNYHRARATENFQYYYGKFVNESYENLLTLFEDTNFDTEGNTPFVPINYNQINTKTEYLLGEFINQGFQPVVTATNKDAFERRKRIKYQIKWLAQLQPMLRRAAQQTGIDYGINDNLPKNDQELEEYMDEYEDVYEQLIGKALSVFIGRYGYKSDTRIKLFLDFVLQAHAHCKIDNIGGYERPRRINPKKAVPDWSTESNFFDDGVHFMEPYYIPISKAIERFDIDKSDIEKMIEAYEDRSVKPGEAWKGHKTKNGDNVYNLWSPFEVRENGFEDLNYDRILIIEAEWLHTKKLKQKRTKDKYGNLHVHEYNREYKTGLSKKEEKRGGEIKKGYKECVKYGVLIGGYDLVEFGETGSYIRDYDNPALTKLRYVSVVHNYNDQDFVSMTERVKVLQDFRNYVMTIMQKEITTNIGGVVAVDTSKIDEDIYGTHKEATKNVLHTAKAYKVVYYNSEKGERPPGPGSIPISQVELKSRTVIQDCIQVAAHLEHELDKITGINDARQGNISDNALVRTTQSSIAQSKKMTASLFQTFQNFEERILERWVEAISIQWVHEPHRYEEFAAMLNIDLPENFNPDIQKWYVEIENYPLSVNELKEAGELSVKQGNLTVDEYYEIMMIASKKNFMEAMKKYITTTQRRREQRRKAEMAMIQAQEQTQDRRAAREDQAIHNREAMKSRAEIEEAKVAAQASKENKDKEVSQRDRQAVSERMRDDRDDQ